MSIWTCVRFTEYYSSKGRNYKYSRFLIFVDSRVVTPWSIIQPQVCVIRNERLRPFLLLREKHECSFLGCIWWHTLFHVLSHYLYEWKHIFLYFNININEHRRVSLRPFYVLLDYFHQRSSLLTQDPCTSCPMYTLT